MPAQRAAFAPPKVYTRSQLEQLWDLAGGRHDEAYLAAAIALAESAGRTDAINHNTDGSIDRGLWQINSVHGSLSTTDPLANARAAVKIQSESRGWEAWTTYKTGAYGKFLPATHGQTAPKAGKDAAGKPEAVEGGATAVVPGLSKLTGWVGELISGLGGVVLKGVLVLAGAVLVIYGIMVAVRPRESAFSLPKAVPVPV